MPTPEARVGPSSLRRVGALLLVAGSTWSAPLVTVATLTFTGDRLLGLAALAGFAFLGIRGRLRWTTVHTALAGFVAVQILSTALNAWVWPQGPKFVSVYVLGFACFALAAEWARGAGGRRWMAGSWLAVAALVSVVGTIAADLANFYQWHFWGTGLAQVLFRNTKDERTLFAAKATFDEWNLFSSFLLIPLALGLWAWRRDVGRQHSLVAALGAIVFGLVAGVTRAAWVAMMAIVALWYGVRRPPGRHLATLGAILAAALLVQALSLGATPVWSRLFERSSMVGRVSINRATIRSWLERPLLGHGAGSINRLTVVLPSGDRLAKVWNGNIELFVLHDSGLLGLATLLGLAVLVFRRAMHAIRREAGIGAPSLTVPLLATGGALWFAYQFTHGLWLMYPYVYLGFLTAVTEAGSGES